MNFRYSLPSELPVILVTYNRPDHTKQVLDALRLHGVQQLYIYSDAPKSPPHLPNVLKTRELFERIDWTTPQVVFQESNQGLAKSIRAAVDRVFQTEEFVILLEDDCVPTRWFFRYMFECYQRYFDNQRVFGVSGYSVNHPEEVTSRYEYDVYFSPRIGSWGWGTWKDRWQYHERELEGLICKCVEAGIDFEQGGNDIPQTLQGMMQGSVKDVWTLHWVLSTYLHKAFYAYPTRSHVQNIGMDGSGVHCGPTDKYDTPTETRNPNRFPEQIVLDRRMYESFRSFYDMPGTSPSEGSYERLQTSLGQVFEPKSEPALLESSQATEIAAVDEPLTLREEEVPVVTHVIEELSLGGAGRALLSIANYTSRIRPYRHRVVSLSPISNKNVFSLAAENGVEVLQADSSEALHRLVHESDIVQLHWWHNPAMEQFLRSELPASRIVAWFHVGGHTAPQRVSEEIVRFVDFVLPCSPYTAECQAIRALPPEERIQRVAMAYGCADFERLKSFSPKPSSGFRVGYVGTLNFLKMHPDFVEMSALVGESAVEFHLWGGGGCENLLKQQAHDFGIGNRMFLHGYAEDICEPLSQIDVFGYPLREDTYAAAEVVLQEVMYAGVVPVVFPYGGLKHLVVDNFTGLVVNSKQEYAHAIEYLYRNPKELRRLSNNAREYAAQIFGAENAAGVVDDVYQRMLKSEKHERRWEPGAHWRDELSPQHLHSGAGIFCQTLGPEAAPFLLSLGASDDETLLKAEEEITKVTTLFRTGGLEAYAATYAGDPYLHLWCGLASLGAGMFETAVQRFSYANQLGLSHWRCLYYLALSLNAVGQKDQAKELFQQVEQLAPGITLAY